MRIAIAVGHSESHQGARDVDGVSEWAWHGIYADELVDALRCAGHDARRFQRPSGGYTQAMQALTSEVNAWSPDAAIELHFDAGDPTWQGSTALHWPGSIRGASLALRLAARVADAVGTRNRGPRPQRASWADAPLLWLSALRCPSVILETHFGTSHADVAGAIVARDDGRLVRAIVEAVDGW